MRDKVKKTEIDTLQFIDNLQQQSSSQSTTLNKRERERNFFIIFFILYLEIPIFSFQV
jgi:hypothetical protein